MNSTTFLQFIAKNGCYILFEKAAPDGKLKRELITLMTHDGKSVGLTTPQGFSTGQLEMPRSMFDDFVAASLIEQDRQEDSDGRIFYRLTKDGLARSAA